MVQKRIIKFLLVLLSAMMTVTVLAKLSAKSWVGANESFKYGFSLPGAALILLLALIVLLIFAGVFMLSKNPKYQGWLRFGILAMIVLVMIGGTIVIPFKPVFDSLAVNQQAVKLAEGHLQWPEYFSVFGNNVAITLLLAALDWPVHTLINTPEHWLLYNALIGQVLTFLSIYTLGDLVRRYVSERAEILFFLAALGMPVYLVQFGQVAYSDNIGWALAIFGITLILNAFERKGRRFILPALGGALLLGLAILVRANVAVVVVVIIGGLLLTQLSEWRKTLVLVLLIVIGLLGAQQAIKAGETFTQYRPQTTAEMPIESWFLTAYYDGGRNGEKINEITDKYTNYDQRKAYIRKMLMKKLDKMGPIGVIELWRRKTNILYGWSTDFGMDNFRKFRTAQERSTHYFNKLMKKIIVISQATMTAMMVGTIFIWLVPIGESKARTSFVVLIAGFFVAMTYFYVLLWEVQEHYAMMPILPLLITGVIGWQALWNRVQRK